MPKPHREYCEYADDVESMYVDTCPVCNTKYLFCNDHGDYLDPVKTQMKKVTLPVIGKCELWIAMCGKPQCKNQPISISVGNDNGDFMYHVPTEHERGK